MTRRSPGGKARFVILVEAKDGGQATIHNLRWLLKQLGHRGLRCIDARPAPPPISDEFDDDDFSARALKEEIDVRR